MAAAIKDTLASMKEGLGVRTNLISDIDVNKFREQRNTIKADPMKGKLKFHVECSAIGDMTVKTEIKRFEIGGETYKHSKTFTVYSDHPAEMLGKDNGPTPVEQLLTALGSCLCMSFLKKAAYENFNCGSVCVKVKGKVDLHQALQFYEQKYEQGQLPQGQGLSQGQFTQGHYTQGQYTQGQQWNQQDTPLGLRAICAKFSVQPVGKDEMLDREKLRTLVDKAAFASIVCQTLKRGNNICVCLKGEGREFESQYGMGQRYAQQGLYEKGKDPLLQQGSNLPTSGLSKQFEVGLSPDTKEYGARDTSIPISGTKSTDTFYKKETTR